MRFFKQKTYFPQFLVELIGFQFDFLEENFDKLLVLADEFKVLTEKDKESFLDKTHELIIVDITMRCGQLFYKNLSSEEVGETVSIVYAKYLTVHKKVSKVLAEKKIESSIELFELVCKSEEDIQKCDEYHSLKIDNGIDEQKRCLCSGFAEYCAGENIKVENWEGKHFAAFKLAKAFVEGDIVANCLKHCIVTF